MAGTKKAGTKKDGTKNKGPVAPRAKAKPRPTAPEMVVHPPTSGAPPPDDSEEKPPTKAKPLKADSLATGKTQATSKRRSPGRAGAAKLLSSGPPDEPIEGGWTGNWIKKVYQRQSVATKGSTD